MFVNFFSLFSITVNKCFQRPFLNLHQLFTQLLHTSKLFLYHIFILQKHLINNSNTAFPYILNLLSIQCFIHLFILYLILQSFNSHLQCSIECNYSLLLFNVTLPMFLQVDRQTFITHR